MKRTLDSMDQKILKTLAKKGRITNAELASDIGIAPSASLNRIRKLEEEKFILSYHAKLNHQLTGSGFLTFVLVKTNGQSNVRKISQAFLEIANVIEVHQTAGEDCFLIKVRTQDTAQFAEILNERIAKVPGIAGTKTIIALSTFKEEMNP